MPALLLELAQTLDVKVLLLHSEKRLALSPNMMELALALLPLPPTQHRVGLKHPSLLLVAMLAPALWSLPPSRLGFEVAQSSVETTAILA